VEEHRERVGALRLVKAVLILPGTAAVLIPSVLLFLERDITPGFASGRTLRGALFASGLLLLLSGLLVAYHTVRLFTTVGKGTPAPWDPPRRLVLRGAYRHVRNPMITAAVSILLGEALLLGSSYILAWTCVFFGGNHIYFVLSEEPSLQRRFGEEYRKYQEHVPRWIPRLTPWSPGGRHEGGEEG
jgi:protein-S-isoprenylcysteine O-methyltransferase Ste14